jgi:AraC family transcriptional regulator of adaptative response/methylated-DNA-[protein]-cysteine methyltransferase
VIDWRLTNDQQAAALRIVQEIPYGTSRSYHLLADELSAYDCGHLLGSNPLALMIPCHRVTRGTERLRAYVGGIERLGLLTALEEGSP